MQQKESKTNWHFWISFFKSIIRILASLSLIGNNLLIAGLLFILAEFLGIMEEL